MLIAAALAAICLSGPVNGPIVAGYSPSGSYQGHWGVDFAGQPGEDVMAPIDGRVSFAGSVAGMRSVTIQPAAGYKVSVSYLDLVSTVEGAWVTRGDIVGRAGRAHGRWGVHLSVRVGGRYFDPTGYLGCAATDIARALRLVEPPRFYPRRRAQRHPGRNLRSHPFGAPGSRGGGTVERRSRPGLVHAGR